ncbi:MAG: hypothetical protein FJ308_03690 [Planctomycetes bacterium]|nr:hypothetical protein [Planctomycetota bacterium]
MNPIPHPRGSVLAPLHQSISPLLVQRYHAVAGVIAYEFRRTITPWRIALWVFMIAIPVALTVTVAYQLRGSLSDDPNIQMAFAWMLYVLMPQAITMLGMLLWATPIVNSELESQSWIYSIVRPGGRQAMLLGKYVIAVLWTSSCGAVASTLAVPMLNLAAPFYNWLALVALCILSSIAHGALFAFIGVMFQRRAMVLAFTYTVLVEVVLGWIPAVINKFTVAFRLRSLYFQWLELPMVDFLENPEMIASQTSSWIHISCLLMGSAVLLAVAAWRVERAQYRWQSEV